MALFSVGDRVRYKRNYDFVGTRFSHKYQERRLIAVVTAVYPSREHPDKDLLDLKFEETVDTDNGIWLGRSAKSLEHVHKDTYGSI